MDVRRYNIMMLEAQAQAQQIIADFERRFYSRQIESGKRNMAVLQSLQQVMAAPEPLEPIAPPEMLMPEEMPMPEFEEADYG